MIPIQFYKVNPTANMTILVETPLPRDKYASVSAELMAYEHVFAEQVGFIEKPSDPAAYARLQMMGGEFCGNASMSLAAVLAQRDGISLKTVIPLEVSGANGLVRVMLAPQQDGFLCRVGMPLPDFVGKFEFPVEKHTLSLPFVRFPGIAFAIAQDMSMDAEIVIPMWHAAVGGDAFGILLWNAKTHTLRPLVRVQATHSAVWEHGCGSGTSAIGAWLSALANAPVQANVRQPGGTIRVYADLRNGLLDIEGSAIPVCHGTAYIRESVLK